MNCPWLKGKSIKQCGAVQSPVVLSGCELSSFCNNGNYGSCPIYRARQRLQGDRISLTEYSLIYYRWTRNLSLPEGRGDGS
jgi:hypothetical protein